MSAQNEREFINEIAIKLTNYEDERKKRLTKLVFQELIALVIAYFSYFGFEHFALKEISFLVIICGFVLLCAVVYFFMNISDTNKDFKKFLKQRCRKNIMKTFNLETMKGIEFSEETLIKSNLFSTFNKMEHDDVIEGKHNDVDYTIAETKLIQVGSKNTELTAFKGVIISFKSNKKINAETLVTTKGDSNIRNYPTGGMFITYWFIFSMIFLISLSALFIFDFTMRIINAGLDIGEYSLKLLSSNLIPFIIPVFGLLVILYVYHVQKKKMQDVKLEAAAFEKRFNVYTKDQIEARYLLTTSFMDRLQNLETAFGTRKIKCSFFDGQIMFAIPTKRDLFELGCLFKPLSSTSDIKNFYKELTSIQQMIDHFKLDEKTGL